MTLKQALLIVATATLATGQRPSFAGSRPIGYPNIITSTAATDELGNRFGEDNSTASTPTTTQRLPIEANGDRDLVDRLSKLPINNQPFWFINWQAYEANRNKPQTYPLRPSSFAQPISPGFNTNLGLNNNINAGGNQANLGNSNDQNEPNVSNPGNDGKSGFNSNVNPSIDNLNTGTANDTKLSNRNGEIDVTNTAKPGPLVQLTSTDVAGSRTDQVFNLGNRNGDIVTNPTKPQHSFQSTVNTAALVSNPSSNPGNQVSNNRIRNVGGVPYPLWANQYPQQHNRNQFLYNGSTFRRFKRNFEDNTDSSVSSKKNNVNVVDTVKPSQTQLYTGKADSTDESINELYIKLIEKTLNELQILESLLKKHELHALKKSDMDVTEQQNRYRRDTKNTFDVKKPSQASSNTEPEDFPSEIIRDFHNRVGKTVLDTVHLLAPYNKKPNTEQVEKLLNDTIQILEENNEIHEKYYEVDTEDIQTSGPRTESPIEEAIRKQMCENKDKLAALLSRVPIGHDKCDKVTE